MRRAIAAAALFVSLVVVSCAVMQPKPEELSRDGLVAYWPFDEGAGTVLHDQSGNENHGTIKGARWVGEGVIYALDFDGVDDSVDCGAGPSLDLREKVSMLAWICQRPQIKRGEPGIIGKAFASYVATQYGNTVYTYVSDEPGTGDGWKAAFSPMPAGGWHHIACTFDGKVLRLYVDGGLASTAAGKHRIASGGKFWMGRSDGDLRFTRDAHFSGKIREVKVYNRALTPEEISHHARTSNLTHNVVLSIAPVPWKDELLVEADTRGLGIISGRFRVDVKVFKKDELGMTPGHALLKGSLADFDTKGRALLKRDASMLEPGKYQVAAVAKKSWARKIGLPGTAEFEWERMPEFPQATVGGRKLNNLVTELLNVPDPDTSGKKFSFVNPRKGWVFISNCGSDVVEVAAEGSSEVIKIALDEQSGDARETMRRLPQGGYTLTTACADRLIVRAVPALVFVGSWSNPLVREFGPFQGEFHQKYVFKNINTFATESCIPTPFGEQWKRRGRDWIAACTAPRGTQEKPLTVDDAYKFLTEQAAFSDPYMDGVIADEFGFSEPHCAIWAKAVDRFLGEAKYQGKVYWPYAYDLWTGEPGREFVAALVKRDCAIAWKRYLKEQRTEGDAWRILDGALIGSARNYREKCPGSLPHIVVCFGYLSAPPEQFDTFPHVNHKTWLDMQFNVVANHPAFQDVGGLMTYHASYCDEETVRWGAKLFRHYGIEGKTGMMSDDPYILTHLENPDFERQGEGWTLQPAEEGSIRFDRKPGFGWLQGRYPRTSEGDTVLITKRSENKPNTFSQEIKNLEPGRLYNLRMFSGDFKDLSAKVKHAVSVRIDGATLIRDKCFDAVVFSCHPFGPYKAGGNNAYMNWHWRVFRAKGKTARLTISDWATDKEPGGPAGAGQELMYNFAQVQPYFEE